MGDNIDLHLGKRLRRRRRLLGLTQQQLAGACGVALISAVMDAPDVGAAARDLLARMR